MIKNHLVKFLVDKGQLEKIRLNALAKGHKTVSSYLRDLALNKDLHLELMLKEIHTKVVKNGE